MEVKLKTVEVRADGVVPFQAPESEGVIPSQPPVGRQRHRNRDRTTEVVTPPSSDYESEVAMVSYIDSSAFNQVFILTQILG